ncbi:MAG: alpha/beta fold hydrolase [Acidimicrobiia bacterium]
MTAAANSSASTPTGDDFDEFAFLPEIAAEVGLDWDGGTQVTRVAVEVNPGQFVSAIRWGTQPPEVVFMHGGGQNAHVFDTVAMLLGRPALSIDLPGQGHSTWRADKAYWPTTNAEAVAIVLDHFASVPARPLVVVGMSLGGLTGIRLAAVRPDLVSHLVVVDVTPGVMRHAVTLTPEQRGVGALMLGPREFDFEETLAIAVAASPSGNAAKLRRGLMFNARPLDDGRWTWRYDELRFPDSPMIDHAHLWDDVPRIIAPTMLVRGSRSHHVDAQDAEQFRALLPSLRVEMVEGASHSVQGSKPVELAALVREFALDTSRS